MRRDILLKTYLPFGLPYAMGRLEQRILMCVACKLNRVSHSLMGPYFHLRFMLSNNLMCDQ